MTWTVQRVNDSIIPGLHRDTEWTPGQVINTWRDPEDIVMAENIHM